MERSSRPGIGHNRAPGNGWQRYCWGRARKELIGHVPIEVVRMRMRRAKELGLAYPQYASILTGTGRDVVGFLFTAEGLRLKLARQLEMPQEVREKLHGLVRCDRLALSPEAEVPSDFIEELQQVAGVEFAGCGSSPATGANWGAARRRILDVLAPLRLPGDAVVLIGSREEEAGWKSAAKLGGFILGQDYFTEQMPS